MKTASVILGIIGGVLAILCALFIFFGSLFFSGVLAKIENSENLGVYHDDKYDLNEEISDSDTSGIFKGLGAFTGIYGSFVLLAGVLGAVGAIYVNMKNKMAGIFMLVGGAIMFITIWGFFIAVMLFLGGIFALIQEKKDKSEIQSSAISN